MGVGSQDTVGESAAKAVDTLHSCTGSWCNPVFHLEFGSLPCPWVWGEKEAPGKGVRVCRAVYAVKLLCPCEG